MNKRRLRFSNEIKKHKLQINILNKIISEAYRVEANDHHHDFHNNRYLI